MKRVFTALTVVLLMSAAMPLSAQQNEIGVFVSMAQIGSESFSHPDFEEELSIDFEPQPGFGVSYNRYWTDHLSTEFAAQQINADAEFRIRGGGLDLAFDLGSTELMVYSAVLQWQFAGREAGFAPYIGAGAAFATGSFDITNDLIEPVGSASVEFETETTFIVNAGVDFRVTPSLAIGVDAKYIPVEALEKDAPEEEALDLNPLVLAAVIKLRF